jgi:hypothetical protein
MGQLLSTLNHPTRLQQTLQQIRSSSATEVELKGNVFFHISVPLGCLYFAGLIFPALVTMLVE